MHRNAHRVPSQNARGWSWHMCVYMFMYETETHAHEANPHMTTGMVNARKPKT